MSPNGAGRSSARAGLAMLFLIGDVLIVRWMLKSGALSTRIGPRLLLDVLDSAVWSALAPDSDEATIIPMVTSAPLAAEAGFVYRWPGVALACAAPAAALAVRAACGQRLRWSQAVWPLASALPGPFVRLIDDWLAARVDAVEGQIVARVNEERRQESARIAFSADPIVDELRDIGRKLQLATGVRTGWEQLAAYKQQLTTWATGDGRAFLGSELLAWAAAHRSYDVQQPLVFDVDKSAAPMVLNAAQRASLRAVLDAAQLSGTVHVAVLRSARAGLRSTNAVVTLNRVAVELPGPVPLTVRQFDGAVIVQALTAVFMLMPMSADNGGARWWSCAPTSAAAAVQALWTARTNPSFSASGRRRTLNCAGLIQLVHTVLLSRALRSTHNAQGRVRLPSRHGLFGLMMTVGGQLRVSSVADRGRLIGWTAAACVAAWVTAPRPRQVSTWLADVLGALPGIGVMVSIKDATDRLTDEWTLDTDQVRAAVADQRRQTCDQLRTWHDQLAALFAEPDLVHDLRGPLAERLGAMASRITALRAGDRAAVLP